MADERFSDVMQRERDRINQEREQIRSQQRELENKLRELDRLHTVAAENCRPIILFSAFLKERSETSPLDNKYLGERPLGSPLLR